MQRQLVKVTIENGVLNLYKLLHSRIDNLRLSRTHPFDLIQMLFSFKDYLLLITAPDKPIDITTFSTEINSLVSAITQIHTDGVRIEIIDDPTQVEDTIKEIIDNLDTEAKQIEKSLEGGELPVLILHTGGTLTSVRDKNNQLASGQHSQSFKKHFEDEIAEAKSRAQSGNRLNERQTLLSTLELDLKRIEWEEVFPEGIDSSKMEPQKWNDLALLIHERRSKYRGIVVIHGTDTLMYTAAAVHFALPRDPVPVIFTASMVHWDNPISDAVSNLIGAINIIDQQGKDGFPRIGMAWVWFNGKLLHPAKIRKVHANNFDAFRTFNRKLDPVKLQPSGTLVWEDSQIEDINEDILSMSENSLNHLRILSEHVHIFHLYPGFSFTALTALQSESDAIVLVAYGSGNGPPELKEHICYHMQTLPVLVCTECIEGVTTSDYAVSLTTAGVHTCSDMTPAAAMTAVASLIHWGVYQHALKDFKEAKDAVRAKLIAEFKDEPLIRRMFKAENTTIESDLITRHDRGGTELSNKVSQMLFEVDVEELKQKMKDEVAAWVEKRKILEKVNEGSAPHKTSSFIGGAMFKWIDRRVAKLRAERDTIQRYILARRRFTGVTRALAWLISLLKVNAHPVDSSSKTVKKLHSSHWLSLSKYMQQIEFNRKLEQSHEHESA